MSTLTAMTVFLIILFACVTTNAKSPVCFEGEFEPNRALMLTWGNTTLHKDKAVWDSTAFFSARPSKKNIFKGNSYEESNFFNWPPKKKPVSGSSYEEPQLAISRPDKALKARPDGTDIVLITETVRYDPEEQYVDNFHCDVLLGAQLWSRQGTMWCLQAQDRAITHVGGIGHLSYEDVKVVKVGPERTGVLFEDDIGKGGRNPIISTLIIPKGEGFNLAFEEITADDNTGFYGKKDSRSFQYTAKIDFVPGQDAEYFDLRIITSGTNIDKRNHRIPWNREKIYVIDNGRYVLKTDRPIVIKQRIKK